VNDEIVFYHNPMSRAAIVRRMLEEVGVPYRVELLRFDRGDHKQPSYLRINPMGKVPTIVHRGIVVTEAAAICTYLADAFPEARLAPAIDDPRRGIYLRWLFFGAGCVEPAISDHALSRTSAPASAIGYGSYDDVVRALHLAIEPGPFVLGEQFSAADVYLGSQVVWGLMTKSLTPTPELAAYAQRCSERPAAQRARALDEALGAQLR